MSSLGDMNADGRVDLVVGAQLEDSKGTNAGAALVLAMGGSAMSPSPSPSATPSPSLSPSPASAGQVVGARRIVGNGSTSSQLNVSAEGRFGDSIVTLGDVDLDGVPDVAVGASRDDDGAADAGAVWVLFMRQDGSCKAA